MRTDTAQLRSIVRRDRALQGLAVLFDGPRLCERLGAAVAPLRVDAAALTYLRYKPGTNCLAKYRLRTSAGPIQVYAKAYGEDARQKLRKDRQRLAVAGSLGTGRWLLADDNIVVSAFPNDAKLPSLGRFANGAEATRLLVRILGPTAQREAPVLTTLAYKPERRFVVKAQLAGADAVIKLMGAVEFSRVHALTRGLPCGVTSVTPRLIGRSRKHGALAFAWLNGQGLRGVTTATTADCALVAAAGTALARFHDQAVGSPVPSCRDFAARLRALDKTLGFLLPTLATRTHELISDLSAWWGEQDETCGVVHGDFYDKQVVIGPTGVHILDIDSVERGNPMRDLGLFVAHLERNAIAHGLDAGHVRRMRDALMRGYAAGGRELDESAVRGYTAMGLAQLAHHPFRGNEPEWPHKIERIVERARVLLSAGASHRQRSTAL